MRATSCPSLVVAALACALVSVGCRTGDASFESTVPGRSFEPGGTVFAYLDEHDANLVEDKDPRVVVVMTWVIFDPTGDLNDLDGSALEEMRHELALRDAVALVFNQQKDVDPGESFSASLLGDQQTKGTALLPRLHFAPERLTGSSTYGDLKPLASRRTVEVGIEEATFDAGAPLSGTLSIKLDASGADPGDALEGDITGTFHAPLVSERTAEQNLALLNVGDTLGLPLAARDP